MKNVISRKLHQLTSNTGVIESNKHNKNANVRQRICITDYSPVEFEELVFLEPKDFELIFGIKDSDCKIKNLPVVKITNPHNGRHVYRLFRTSYEIRGFKEYAGVSYTTIKQIADNREEFETLNKVLLSKGCLTSFYWNHPIHATKVAIHIGVYSLVIGVISLAFTMEI